MSARHHGTLIPALQVTLGAVTISFSSVFVKLAQVGPTSAGFYRMLFGALALLLVLPLLRGGLGLERRALGLSLLAGLFFAADLSVWHRSIQGVGPGLATVLGNFQVFVMVGAGALFLGERLTLRTLLAVLLAIAGLLLLVGPGWGALGPDWRAGVLFGLATALFYSAYMMTLRRMQTARNPRHQVLNMALVAVWTSLLLALSIPLAGESLRIPDGLSFGYLVAYGVLCQALGWYLIARGLPRIELSVTGILILLQPALAFLWDILLFDRPTTRLDLLGASLTLTAIYLAVTRRTAAVEAG